MAHEGVKHDYHLVNPSLWPLIGSVAAVFLALGLVVGLNGTGDGIRNAPFTEEIMANLLERLGVNVAGEE